MPVARFAAARTAASHPALESTCSAAVVGQKRGISWRRANSSRASSFDERISAIRAIALPTVALSTGASTTELFLDIRHLQRVDDGLDVSVHDRGEIMCREA